MRSRNLLYVALLVLGGLALPSAVHAAIPFFGPVIPTEYNQCAASWGLLITVINNSISLVLTLAIVLVTPAMMAYAGFLYVTNATNPSNIEKAKSILTHTITGIVISLGAWLFIDAVMAALYHPTDLGLAGTTWKTLITTGNINPCINLRGSLNQAVPGAGITGIDAGGGQFLDLPTAGDCSPGNLMKVTAGSPYALTQSQANTLSCIAVPESRCGANTNGATQPNGQPTSASGMFQIVFGCKGCNDTCHNLNIPACSAAAGVDGDLNCHTAFRGGAPAPGKEAQAAACKRAAANLGCNAQAAGCLVKANNGYSAWTADSRSRTQQNCISQYASLR